MRLFRVWFRVGWLAVSRRIATVSRVLFARLFWRLLRFLLAWTVRLPFATWLSLLRRFGVWTASIVDGRRIRSGLVVLCPGGAWLALGRLGRRFAFTRGGSLLGSHIARALRWFGLCVTA